VLGSTSRLCHQVPDRDSGGRSVTSLLYREEVADALVQVAKGFLKRLALAFALDGGRVGNAPMHPRRLAGPNRADFALGIVANADYDIERLRIRRGELVPALGAIALNREATLSQQLQRGRVHLALWVTSGRKSAKTPSPSRLRIASARIERAEFPVQRNNTL